MQTAAAAINNWRQLTVSSQCALSISRDPLSSHWLQVRPDYPNLSVPHRLKALEVTFAGAGRLAGGLSFPPCHLSLCSLPSLSSDSQGIHPYCCCRASRWRLCRQARLHATPLSGM